MRIDKVRRCLQTFLILYVVALLTSMAGMEVFAWLSALTGLLALIFFAKPGDLQLRAENNVALWLYFLSVLTSIATNHLWVDKGIAILGTVRWVFLYYFLFWSLQLALKNEPLKMAKVLNGIMVFAIFLGLYGVVQHFTGIDLFRDKKHFLEHSSHYPGSSLRFWRTKGFFSMPLTYAYSYGMFAALLLGLTVGGFFRGRKFIFAILAVGLLYLSVLTTYSRGGWIAAAAAVIVIFYLGLPKKKFFSMLLLLCGVVSLLMVFSDAARPRLTQFFDPAFKSNYERWDLWKANFAMFKDHPFFGVGHGQSEALVPVYFEKLGITDSFIGHAHSNYFQILSTYGGIGFLSYLFFMLGGLWLSYRLWKAWSKEEVLLKGLTLGLVGAQIHFHVGGLTENNFFDGEVNHLLVFLLALLSYLSLYHQRRDRLARMPVAEPTARLKICHLSSVHPPFDTRVFHKESKSLAAAGYEIYLVVRNHFDEVKDGVKILSAESQKRSRMGRVTFGALSVMMAGLKTGATVFHLHDPELLPFGLILKILGKQVIYDAHEDIEKQLHSKEYLGTLTKWFFSRSIVVLQKITLPFFDAIVGATPSIVAGINKYNRQTYNICNYPLLNELTGLERAELTGQKQKVICYVGGISRTRSAREMIESMRSIDGQLILAGEIEGDQLTRDLNQNPGWKKVDYRGLVDREGVKKIMSVASLGLVLLYPEPNHLEALPNKMFEYMAAGLPIVCSRFPLFEQMMKNEKFGLLVDPMSVPEIVSAIKWLLDNPEEAQRMGQRGRELVKTKFNWDFEERKLLQMYQSISSRKAQECLA